MTFAGSKMRGPGCGCCVEGQVLIWDTNGGGPLTTDLQQVYEDMGLVVHRSGSWSGTLADYGLIHWLIAESNPTWWAEITGNTWVGRLHLTAENNGIAATSIAYVNGLTAMTGITITADAIDANCDHNGTAEADDLTAGLSLIKYAFTSRVSGGTTLSKTVTGAHPWLARNKPGGSTIEFVISGDSNHADDSCDVALNENLGLFENMWDVPV